MRLVNIWNVKKLWDHISRAVKEPKLLRDSKWQIELVRRSLKIEEVRIMLKGKKTYLVAILMGVLSAVRAAGLIDEVTYQAILALLSGLGLATLRAGVESTREPVSLQKTPTTD